jgi:hypothetical protein
VNRRNLPNTPLAWLARVSSFGTPGRGNSPEGAVFSRPVQPWGEMDILTSLGAVRGVLHAAEGAPRMLDKLHMWSRNLLLGSEDA